MLYAPAEVADLHASRDERIRELLLLGWSNARVGREIGLSGERIRQLRAKGLERDLELASLERREATIEKRVDAMRQVHDRLAARLAGVDRRLRLATGELTAIREEIEAARIDRLLGLI